MRGRQRLSGDNREFSALAGGSKDILTTGMRMVLRSDFVKRNKVVITFLAINIELRSAKPRILEFRLAFGVSNEGGVA